jgi:hypothetical protein
VDSLLKEVGLEGRDLGKLFGGGAGGETPSAGE